MLKYYAELRRLRDEEAPAGVKELPKAAAAVEGTTHVEMMRDFGNRFTKFLLELDGDGYECKREGWHQMWRVALALREILNGIYLGKCNSHAYYTEGVVPELVYTDKHGLERRQEEVEVRDGESFYVVNRRI